MASLICHQRDAALGWRLEQEDCGETKSHGLMQKHHFSNPSPERQQIALLSRDSWRRDVNSDDGSAFVAMLRRCAKNKDLHRGIQIHEDLLERGSLENCSDALVIMYARCGALGRAQALHDRHKSKNISTWNALVAGYTQQGPAQNALNLFDSMQSEGVFPNAVTYACILKACGTVGSVDNGRQIHDLIMRQGWWLQNDVVLGNALVSMYVKCGSFSEAQWALEELPSRDVISWNILITGFAQDGQGEQALTCFDCMQREGMTPDAVTYASILKACGSVGAVDKGEQAHYQIVRDGLLQDDLVLGTALVDMYAKCSALSRAHSVLLELSLQNTASWNALITGYVQKNKGFQAWSCFERMQHNCISPNAVTYLCILKACGAMCDNEKGNQVHDQIAKKMLQNDVAVGTALVDMYAKCGTLSKASCLFEELLFRDIISWNALITGFAQEGQGEQALKCFEYMQHEGISPDDVTYTCMLKACGDLGNTETGRQFHDQIARQKLLKNNVVLGNSLVGMYAKCGAFLKAQGVFDELPFRNAISWSALTAGYAHKVYIEQVLTCFKHMQCEGITPNAVTYICILKACGSIGATDKGEEIHGQIVREGLLQDDDVLCSALVDMYAKCGAFTKAQDLLEELQTLNVVCWNALLTGFVQEGQGEQALSCFECMQRKGIYPDIVTFINLLKSCGSMGTSEKGEQIHQLLAKQDLLVSDGTLGTALVDMYAKCGAVSKAFHVLEELPFRNVVSWNALIAVYSQEGQNDQAWNCFEYMLQEGILPDTVTLISVLNLCSHVGLIEDGCVLCVDMNTKYGMKPDLECYTCMVDLFGRAGHLNDVVQLIEVMPLSRFPSIWHAVLGACQKWGDVNFGMWAFERTLQVDRIDGTAYVMMANVYASVAIKDLAKHLES